MSIQFGVWNFDGHPVQPALLAEIAKHCSAYAADAEEFLTQGEVAFGYRPFHTTRESRIEDRPHQTGMGNIITLDGRLDNRNELIESLQFQGETAEITDLALVAAAYDRWETGAFVKLDGDWATAIWDPARKTLVLANDFLGSRHLYYSMDDHRIHWSTVLDPLVRITCQRLALNFDWIAGYLTYFPEPNLTPYGGIKAVPPGTLVSVREGVATVRSHWSFDATKTIRHRSDGEYEEHFRAVFSQAVRRRLRTDSPVLAELSGGMDSSSIVCMADALMATEPGGTPRIDTVSYYDDDEPNWDERPFFELVERKRQKTGTHIRITPEDSLYLGCDDSRLPLFPAYTDPFSKPAKAFSELLAVQGHRVLLSGFGGDEVAGGVPTPIPELADLFASGRVVHLARQLKVWALARRKPFLHLFWEVSKQFLPDGRAAFRESMGNADWLNADFMRSHGLACHGSHRRLSLFGAKPSFQGSFLMLGGLQRQLAFAPLPTTANYEKRYPFLDRALLEFLFAIPPEQLVRPRQRRSLMRRALTQIVPSEILGRNRKAFVVRGPMCAIAAKWPQISQILDDLRCAEHRIVDPQLFAKALQRARDGQEVPLVFLLRTLTIESWLRQLERFDFGVRFPISECSPCPSGADRNARSGPKSNVPTHDRFSVQPTSLLS